MFQLLFLILLFLITVTVKTLNHSDKIIASRKMEIIFIQLIRLIPLNLEIFLTTSSDFSDENFVNKNIKLIIVQN